MQIDKVGPWECYNNALTNQMDKACEIVKDQMNKLNKAREPKESILKTFHQAMQEIFEFEPSSTDVACNKDKGTDEKKTDEIPSYNFYKVKLYLSDPDGVEINRLEGSSITAYANLMKAVNDFMTLYRHVPVPPSGDAMDET